MKRPDSIVSVLETPAASSQLNPFSENRNFSGPVALAKRQRVQLSAPQPQSSNVSRVKMASDSKLVSVFVGPGFECFWSQIEISSGSAT